MTLNRREFVATSSLALLGSALGRVPAFAQRGGQPAATAPVVKEFIALRRNVSTFTGRGGVMGCLIAPDAVVVADTQFPDAAEVFLTELKMKSPRRIDLVMNTHHHPDHTGGNKTLKASAAKIVAHANSAASQRKQAATQGTEAQQAYPDETFTDTWKMDVGNEVVRAKYYGTGHTSGDVAIVFERANVVHLGDLMSNYRHPRADLGAGASIRHWVTVLDQVPKDHDADTIYIYGHSKPGAPLSGHRQDLVVMRNYLTAVLDLTQKQIAAGKSRDEVVKITQVPGFPQHEGGLDFTLGAAYDELTRKA